MNKNKKEEPSFFVQKFLKKIEEKKTLKRLSDEFQDAHWNDVYDVYYDSSN